MFLQRKNFWGSVDIFVKSVLFSLGLCIFLKTKEVSEKYTVPVKKAPISQKSPRIPGVFSPQSHLQNRGLKQGFLSKSVVAQCRKISKNGTF